MRAITYARVSTDAQERDGTSLDTQERACLEFARDQGWVVVESVRDAASGFSLDRAGIERVRQILRAGLADVVIAYAVDRSEEHTSELQSRRDLVCRLLLEKKKKKKSRTYYNRRETSKTTKS